MKPALEVHPEIPNTGVLEAPAGHEEEMGPLPFIRGDNFFLTRWEPSEEDRRRIAEGGSVYLWVFGGPMHPPVALTTELHIEAEKSTAQEPA